MIFLNNLKSFTQIELYKTWHYNPILWMFLIFISLVSFIFLISWLHFIKKEPERGKRPVEINDIKSYDSKILDYFVTFIFPVLSLDPKLLPSIVMNFLFLTLVSIYFIKNNSLHYNVLLVILGYHVYTFNDSCILITKMDISQIKLEEFEATEVGSTQIYYL